LSYRFLKSLDGLDALEDKAREVIAQVGLGDKGNLPAKHLSHGEKRILDIAIGLATNPQLLLLDKPAAGLVGDEISRLTGLIRDISKDVTVVLVEHNIDVVLTISDVITVLYYGAIVAEGSPQDIQKNEKVQEIYLGGYQC
jgi:branched-chain amino acid transport system ATP-binding protein